ncbi:MAG: BrnT family toxin [Elusimicrobia bacterium]|nr:BrnT family toxin [Candidatus Obscuribacterium magneticum]
MPRATSFHDPDHSYGESRFITIGLSNQNKVLVVSHADRLGKIRIISVRRATRHERRFYEEEK